MKKPVAAFIFLLLALPASAAYGATAIPSSAAIAIDKSPASFNCYNIDGYTYFMLRDVAYALTGTQKQFDISFSQESGAVSLLTGRKYLGASSDAALGSSAIEASPSMNSFILDGSEIELEAYNIEGRNYLKLRDLCEALEVKVDYNSSTGKISLATASLTDEDFGLGRVGSFATTDLGGAAYTQRIFEEKPLTFINYWATWCKPCLEELPDFPALQEKYRDKVKFITVVDDGNGNSNALELSNQYLKGYTNLLPAPKLIEGLQSGFVPTSAIVNRKGYLVIGQMVGAYGASYSEFIDQALRMIGE
ncbi:MAG: hypothetical protein LBU32_01480 [Clostridiales bacterium]|nr:hypothetical protein [Clostridiales bacterium]